VLCKAARALTDYYLRTRIASRTRRETKRRWRARAEAAHTEPVQLHRNTLQLLSLMHARARRRTKRDLRHRHSSTYTRLEVCCNIHHNIVFQLFEVFGVLCRCTEGMKGRERDQ
jgi:hypothetical protein